MCTSVQKSQEQGGKNKPILCTRRRSTNIYKLRISKVADRASNSTDRASITLKRPDAANRHRSGVKEAFLASVRSIRSFGGSPWHFSPNRLTVVHQIAPFEGTRKRQCHPFNRLPVCNPAVYAESDKLWNSVSHGFRSARVRTGRKVGWRWAFR